MKAGKRGIINNKGKIVIPIKYDEIKLPPTVFLNKKSDLWAYCAIDDANYFVNTNGKEKLIDASFREIWMESDKIASARDKNNIRQLLNMEGRIIPLPKGIITFIEIITKNKTFFQARTPIIEDGLSTLLLDDGSVLLPKGDYVFISDTSSNKIFVSDVKNKKFFSIDENGAKIPLFDWTGSEYFKIFAAEKVYCLGTNGIPSLLDGNFKPIYTINDQMSAIVEVDNRENIYKACLGISPTKYYVVDKKGKVIVPPSFDKLLFNYKQTIVAQNSIGMSVFKENGTKVFEDLKFEGEVYDLNQNLIITYKKNAPDKIYTIYTLEGKKVWEGSLDRLGTMDKIGCVLTKNNLSGLINADGKIVLDFQYQTINTISSLGKNYIIAKKNNLFGLFDSNGKEILDRQYTKINQLDKNYFLVNDNRKWGIIRID